MWHPRNEQIGNVPRTGLLFENIAGKILQGLVPPGRALGTRPACGSSQRYVCVPLRAERLLLKFQAGVFSRSYMKTAQAVPVAPYDFNTT